MTMADDANADSHDSPQQASNPVKARLIESRHRVTASTGSTRQPKPAITDHPPQNRIFTTLLVPSHQIAPGGTRSRLISVARR